MKNILITLVAFTVIHCAASEKNAAYDTFIGETKHLVQGYCSLYNLQKNSELKKEEQQQAQKQLDKMQEENHRLLLKLTMNTWNFKIKEKTT